MKELILCRHGKSSWADPGLGDFDRPLNRRGLRDVPRMGARLAERFGYDGLSVVSSAALRALTTAKILAGELRLAEERIEINERLYDADADTLADEVAALDDAWDRVLLVGHNPGMSDFAVALAGEPLRAMPTCGMVAIRFSVDVWAHASPAFASLEWLDSPKRIGEL